jgi:hypothetical protein
MASHPCHLRQLVDGGGSGGGREAIATHGSAAGKWQLCQSSDLEPAAESINGQEFILGELKRLSKLKANLNQAVGVNGATWLHIVALYGFVGAVPLLLKNGADINQPDSE